MVPVGPNATAIGGATKANTARAAIAIAMRKRTPLLNATNMVNSQLLRGLQSYGRRVSEATARGTHILYP